MFGRLRCPIATTTRRSRSRGATCATSPAGTRRSTRTKTSPRRSRSGSRRAPTGARSIATGAATRSCEYVERIVRESGPRAAGRHRRGLRLHARSTDALGRRTLSADCGRSFRSCPPISTRNSGASSAATVGSSNRRHAVRAANSVHAEAFLARSSPRARVDAAALDRPLRRLCPLAGQPLDQRCRALGLRVDARAPPC